MRLNEPITHREHRLPEGVTLMSSTDLKGRITYANAAFVAASGFEHGALLGQPHNLVRHPDMPAEAFADLWRTLQAGDSWTAVVKNRRQDGDHYWVRANAAPIRQQGRVVGYLSVRTAVPRGEVDAAEALYRRVRDGQARGWRFHKGVLVRRGVLAGLSAGRWMSVRTRLRLGLALPVLGALGACGAAAQAGTPLAPLAAVATGVALAAGLACAWLERQLARPLRAVLQQAQQVAAGQGDGQARLDRVDEVGLLMRAVNQAGLNLRALLDDVGGQLGGLRSASQEIAAGSQDLSARTEHNASSLQQAAASMEELHGTVRHSAEHAQQARDLAGAASGAAGRGSQVVAGVVETMDDISQGARRIGDIVGVIDALAFQTNLLALNAAVEAARAGPQGRGFAVVAGEVRTLAQRCTQAAREIKVLVDTSVQQVNTGGQRVAQAGQAMQGIVDQAQRVERLVGEISRAATEQATGVGQVNDTVNRLDAATQQNAALVEQSAAAAASLAEQAERLAAAVRVFRPEAAATA